MKTEFKKLIYFFDKLEDKIRSRLSHHPKAYALIGGVGIILFWRGVWHLADDINISSSLSFLIGLSILLATGVFVSAFIGSRLIISGLVGEKKITEKTEEEVETEEMQLKNLQSTLVKIEKKLEHIDEDIEKHPAFKKKEGN
ncbi:MAG: hypothetical protein WC783_01360 [Candidatus Paceibacterota bacterium]